MNSPLRGFSRCVTFPFLLLLPFAAHSQAMNGCNSQSSPGVVDFNNPSYYVNVNEIAGERDTIIPIHTALFTLTDTSFAIRHPHAIKEVDRNSLVQITFARENMLLYPELDSKLQISGTLNNQPVEIAGYSLLGKQAPTATTHVQGSGKVRRTLCSFHNVAVDITTNTLKALDNDLSAAAAYLKQRAASIAISEQLANRINGLTMQHQTLTDSRSNTPSERQAALNAKIDSVGSQISAIQAKKQAVDNLPAFQASGPGTNSRIEELRQLGSVLAGSDGEGILEAVSQRTGTSEAALRVIATQLQTARLPGFLTVESVQNDGSASLQNQRSAIETVRNRVLTFDNEVVAYLTALGPLPPISDASTLDNLINTEIDLSAIDAKPGDRLVLNFTNALDTTGLNRRMILNLRVRRFGLASDISDSFLFLHRQHANYQPTPRNVAVTKDTISVGKTVTIDSPAGLNYALAPGAALTWTYYTRNRHSFLDWLRPGFGIQVSFPSYKTDTYTVSRQPDSAAGSKNVSVIQESRSNTLDIATGVILTGFDNLIGVSYGHALTAREAPNFGPSA